jgi:hypothetical protein
MSIRVVCPNGHVLNVKKSLAGKVGLCPTCKARVQVPEPRRQELSEDAIMRILGPHVPGPAVHAAGRGGSDPAETLRSSDAEGNSPPKKSCHKCNREISSAIHICPFCHTYIAELSDF